MRPSAAKPRAVGDSSPGLRPKAHPVGYAGVSGTAPGYLTASLDHLLFCGPAHGPKTRSADAERYFSPPTTLSANRHSRHIARHAACKARPVAEVLFAQAYGRVTPRKVFLLATTIGGLGFRSTRRLSRGLIGLPSEAFRYPVLQEPGVLPQGQQPPEGAAPGAMPPVAKVESARRKVRFFPSGSGTGASA